MAFNWKIDECTAHFDRMRLRGWCFASEQQIVAVEAVIFDGQQPVSLASYGLPSPDIAAALHSDAHHVRFDDWVLLPEPQGGQTFRLRFRFADGTALESSPIRPDIDRALHWKIDECAAYFDRMRLCGWCFTSEKQIVAVEALFLAGQQPTRLPSFGLPSPDVVVALHPNAHHVRFDDWVPLPEAQRGKDFTLRFQFADGTASESSSVHQNARKGDAFYASWDRFLNMLHALPRGDVLEIGSRARSGFARRQFIPAHLGYVGLDILPGPNVDIVGDAHTLSTVFSGRKFVAAFSCSVFEHLAMPWKVVIELNRVLEPGALVHMQTHQTWPVHDEPWDFWRFSAFSWQCLFNPATGFELLETTHGEPASIHPFWDSPVVRAMHDCPAWLGTSVTARKTGETSLDWPVPTAMVSTGFYPKGELSELPR